MTHFIRASALQGFASTCREGGVDGVSLAVDCGIPPEAFEDPDVRFPLDAFGRALDRAAQETGFPDFAIRMAESRRPSTWGVMGLLANVQATARRALEVAAAHADKQMDGAGLELVDHGAETHVRLLYKFDEASPTFETRYCRELMVASCISIVRAMLGWSWNPQAVYLDFADDGLFQTYRHAFGASPVFSADFLGFTCKARDLDRPLAQADSEAGRLLSASLNKTGGSPG